MSFKLLGSSAPDYFALALDLGLKGSPSGSNLYCKCPFHNDRSASFSLNIRTGLWFCHAEQRGGNFDMFVAEMLGLDIGSARRWIADQGYTPRLLPEEPAQAEPECLEETYAAVATEELPLWWFQERGLSWETAERFGVRYDKLRGRLVIPVRFPASGPIVGLIYRSMNGELPKYKNSIDFPRKTTLFNYHPQLRAERILLTEGPMDAINAVHHGFYAVATFGAYVTDTQLRLLDRIGADQYIIAYDNPEMDEAGKGATKNVALSRLTQRMDIPSAVFRFPPGVKDLGDCSAEDIRRGIASATDTLRYYTERIPTHG